MKINLSLKLTDFMVDLLTHREASRFPLSHPKIKKNQKFLKNKQNKNKNKTTNQLPTCREHSVNYTTPITDNYKRSCILIPCCRDGHFLRYRNKETETYWRGMLSGHENRERPKSSPHYGLLPVLWTLRFENEVEFWEWNSGVTMLKMYKDLRSTSWYALVAMVVFKGWTWWSWWSFTTLQLLILSYSSFILHLTCLEDAAPLVSLFIL